MASADNSQTAAAISSASATAASNSSVLLCQQCSASPAALSCRQCLIHQCFECAAKRHRAGTLTQHVFTIVIPQHLPTGSDHSESSTCSQCDQPSTVACPPCALEFCSRCAASFHEVAQGSLPHKQKFIRSDQRSQQQHYSRSMPAPSSHAHKHKRHISFLPASAVAATDAAAALQKEQPAMSLALPILSAESNAPTAAATSASASASASASEKAEDAVASADSDDDDGNIVDDDEEEAAELAVKSSPRPRFSLTLPPTPPAIVQEAPALLHAHPHLSEHAHLSHSQGHPHKSSDSDDAVVSIHPKWKAAPMTATAASSAHRSSWTSSTPPATINTRHRGSAIVAGPHATLGVQKRASFAEGVDHRHSHSPNLSPQSPAPHLHGTSSHRNSHTSIDGSLGVATDLSPLPLPSTPRRSGMAGAPLGGFALPPTSPGAFSLSPGTPSPRRSVVAIASATYKLHHFSFGFDLDISKESAEEERESAKVSVSFTITIDPSTCMLTISGTDSASNNVFLHSRHLSSLVSIQLAPLHASRFFIHFKESRALARCEALSETECSTMVEALKQYAQYSQDGRLALTEADALFCGRVLKKGKMNLSWSVRYLMLKKYSLRLYKTKAMQAPPAAQCSLMGARVSLPKLKDKTGTKQFLLTTSDKKELVFKASSVAERDSMIALIQRAMEISVPMSARGHHHAHDDWGAHDHHEGASPTSAHHSLYHTTNLVITPTTAAAASSAAHALSSDSATSAELLSPNDRSRQASEATALPPTHFARQHSNTTTARSVPVSPAAHPDESEGAGEKAVRWGDGVVDNELTDQVRDRDLSDPALASERAEHLATASKLTKRKSRRSISRDFANILSKPAQAALNASEFSDHPTALAPEKMDFSEIAAPSESYLRPSRNILHGVWSLMSTLLQSISSGAMITPQIFVPKSVWYQSNAKLRAFAVKSEALEILRSASLSLRTVDLSDGDDLERNLYSFRLEIDEIQDKLAQHLSFIHSVKEPLRDRRSLGSGEKALSALGKLKKNLKTFSKVVTRATVGVTRDKVNDSQTSKYVKLLKSVFDSGMIFRTIVLFMSDALDLRNEAAADRTIGSLTARSAMEMPQKCNWSAGTRAAVEDHMVRIAEFWYSVVCHFALRDLKQLIKRYMKHAIRSVVSH